MLDAKAERSNLQLPWRVIEYQRPSRPLYHVERYIPTNREFFDLVCESKEMAGFAAIAANSHHDLVELVTQFAILLEHMRRHVVLNDESLLMLEKANSLLGRLE